MTDVSGGQKGQTHADENGDKGSDQNIHRCGFGNQFADFHSNNSDNQDGKGASAATQGICRTADGRGREEHQRRCF